MSQIKSLIIQGEAMKTRILPKSCLQSKKKEIITRHRNSKPVNNITTSILSEGAGEIVSSILCTGKRKTRSITNQVFKNKIKQQQDAEIRLVELQFESHNQSIEAQYFSWFNEIKRILSNPIFSEVEQKILDSQYKSKIETKLQYGVNGLKKMIDFLEKSNVDNKNQSIFIRSGEPLKGRDAIIDFVRNSKLYLKIQDPYPSKELLRILENVDTYENINIKLLIGQLKSKERSQFEHELSLLRKSGRNIDVVSVFGDKSAPFHDRYIINEKSSITLGTSLSGFGMRDSSINYLTQWQDIEKRLDEYMTKTKIIHRGKECNRLKI